MAELIISTLALSIKPLSSSFSIHWFFKTSVGTILRAELSSFLFTKASIRSTATFVLPKPVHATIVAIPPDFNHF